MKPLPPPKRKAKAVKPKEGRWYFARKIGNRERHLWRIFTAWNGKTFAETTCPKKYPLGTSFDVSLLTDFAEAIDPWTKGRGK